jgi:hypothetical protein
MAYVRKTYQEMVNLAFVRAEDEDFEVEEISDTELFVRNLDKNTIYSVSLDGDYVVDCDCPHHTYRGVLCKHMVAVSNVTGKYVFGM